MAYSILINNVERSTDVLTESITVEDAINDKQNICTLDLVNLSGNGIPDTGEEIIITLADDTKLFAGYITNVSVDKVDTGIVKATLSCQDYVWLLDRNLVHKTYENMTDKEIITAVIETYCPNFGITLDNVIEGVTIEQISFNYLQPSEVFRKICDLTGRNWYIDYEKDLHYFPLSTSVTPFNIDSSANEYFELNILKDANQLKNRVYVRGGTKLSDTTTHSTKGDGVKRQFVLPDKPHDISITVNGSAKTIGIKNIDLSGYDWYLNYQEKYIEQDSGGTVLATTDTLVVTYKYDVPILVAVEDTASIQANGAKEFAIFDKSIATTESARDRASSELTDYANNIIEGSFKTYTSGFTSGQYININLTDYDVNADYIVQKVTAESVGGGSFIYTVEIASSKTMGIIRFLIELLEANKNLIELDDQEVVDELFQCQDSLLSDSLTEALTIDSAGAYATWTTADESSPVTRARWDLYQW